MLDRKIIYKETTEETPEYTKLHDRWNKLWQSKGPNNQETQRAFDILLKQFKKDINVR